ncbi:MAG TPA: zinc-ribbon domain-containing protein [Terriglobales bacterium]|nr:zinc-ribbon domain-containing protein [Terriglobales bacterium]
MYCWSCGHKNADDNKFCGECGKKQVRPPVFADEEVIDDNIKTMNPPPPDRRRLSDERPLVSELVRTPVRDARPPTPVVPPPGTGITPTQRLSGSNPLVEEPRAVKDSPLASSVGAETVRPSPVVNHVEAVPVARTNTPTRISGPSFLGLSDAPAESSDYLLDEDVEGSSTLRTYVALALILLFGVLIYKQWDNVSALGKDLAQRAGVTSTPSAKPSPTSSDENIQTTSADSKPAEETTTAKAEQKPESDNADAGANRNSADPEATEEDATKKETAPPEPKSSSKSADKSSLAAEATAPVYDDSQVELAQKYLQGRGVTQDCNRGVSLLRSAASQPNPKAQIKLGALYATGYCVSQNKAEAYRWFAEAHQLQPGNQWIDKNLNSLWSEMTSEERARAQR